MKISIDCRSPLLQKSLEKFLEGMIAEEAASDIVVTDYERKCDRPSLRIGGEEADLHKPFSRSQLMIRLEEKLAKGRSAALASDFAVEEEETPEARIERAARRFVDEIIAIVKECREKGA
jgi:hypothetical protein